MALTSDEDVFEQQIKSPEEIERHVEQVLNKHWHNRALFSENSGLMRLLEKWETTSGNWIPIEQPFRNPGTGSFRDVSDRSEKKNIPMSVSRKNCRAFANFSDNSSKKKNKKNQNFFKCWRLFRRVMSAGRGVRCTVARARSSLSWQQWTLAHLG